MSKVSVQPIEEPLLVRATIALPGLPLGSYAVVDPSDPYIAAALASQMLVPEQYDEE